MTIHIDNPEIEKFFTREFKSDIKKFSEFILINLKKNKQKNAFHISPLSPKEHAYTLNYAIDEEEMSNPFKDIDDVATYSKQLRESAWR
jgi:hypothetical protein